MQSETVEKVRNPIVLRGKIRVNIEVGLVGMRVLVGFLPMLIIFAMVGMVIHVFKILGRVTV